MKLVPSKWSNRTNGLPADSTLLWHAPEVGRRTQIPPVPDRPDTRTPPQTCPEAFPSRDGLRAALQGEESGAAGGLFTLAEDPAGNGQGPNSTWNPGLINA
jgi:hypothetical protein